jgi:membrane dipeptidase
MRFFDAHCDTVMRAFEAGLDFVKGGSQAQTDLPRLLQAGHCIQLFAVFTTGSNFPDQERLRAYAEQAIETIHGWAETSDGRLRLALTADDLRAACDGSALYGLIGLEGADPLGDRAENLEYFYRLGVRSVIPAWGDNAFSGTTFGAGGPLTPEGFKLIELAEALGMMVDVSHLSDAAFEQVCQVARRPFIASHSNCRALCPNPRNLTDEMIRSVAGHGGVMGINLAPYFLDPSYLAAWDAVTAPVRAADAATRQALWEAAEEPLRAIPLPAIEWIARHARHAMNAGGEDCVGLGGDLDGIGAMPAGISGAESYPLIAESLASAGFTEMQVEKICWRNMARVFEKILQRGE